MSHQKPYANFVNDERKQHPSEKRDEIPRLFWQGILAGHPGDRFLCDIDAIRPQEKREQPKPPLHRTPLFPDAALVLEVQVPQERRC